jgi:hypothetical protein
VWNLGTLPATPVFVNFYYAAPSLGIQPSAPKIINDKKLAVAFVPPLSAVVVQCPEPWTPPVTEGNLHSCLLVTCSAPISGDVPSPAFNPVADRHTGQHNYTVIEAGAGAEFSFNVHLGNLEPLAVEVQLMAAAAWHPHPLPGPTGFSVLPSPTGPVNAILDSKTTRPNLWARRAALILQRPAAAYQQLPADEVQKALRVTGIRRGEVRRSPAIVPPLNRFGTVSAAFAPVGDVIELRPQQQANAAFSITTPRRGPHPWFVAQLAQVTHGSIVGGYTVAIKRH